MTPKLLRVLLWVATCVPAVVAQDRETKVRSDRERVEAAGNWIYNDLPRGVAEAKQTGIRWPSRNAFSNGSCNCSGASSSPCSR